MALQSSLGMICDPIGNRVEAPCLGKNVLAATNAVSCANMAIADYQHLIPLDQVMQHRQPDLLFGYLPHLDYDLQRFGPDPEVLARCRREAGGRASDPRSPIGGRSDGDRRPRSR